MRSALKCFILAASLMIASSAYASNVGLLIMATGKYIQFVQPLIDSANKHFLRNHHVTYFVFTDQEFDPDEHTVVAFQARLGWPYDTMMRYHTYYKYRDLFADQDYLFALDADMLFVNTVGDEVLGERVATQHPGFVGRRGTYETCAYSNAFVSEVEGDIYFAGGFYGASTEEFLQILQTNIEMIDDDLNRGYIAVWHDESHWNRYCIDHPPTVILSPSYCYPESWKLNFPKKLLALDKNHHEIRQ